MTPEEWRERVGRHVEARRKALRFRSIRAAAQAAGVSEGLWRQVESGRRQVAKGVIQTTNPGPDKTAAICRALDWSEDSIDRLVRGERPTRATLVEASSRMPPVDLPLTVKSVPDLTEWVARFFERRYRREVLAIRIDHADTGVTPGTVAQLVHRGTLDRHPDGHITRASVLMRLAR